MPELYVIVYGPDSHHGNPPAAPLHLRSPSKHPPTDREAPPLISFPFMGRSQVLFNRRKGRAGGGGRGGAAGQRGNAAAVASTATAAATAAAAPSSTYRAGGGREGGGKAASPYREEKKNRRHPPQAQQQQHYRQGHHREETEEEDGGGDDGPTAYAGAPRRELPVASFSSSRSNYSTTDGADLTEEGRPYRPAGRPETTRQEDDDEEEEEDDVYLSTDRSSRSGQGWALAQPQQQQLSSSSFLVTSTSAAETSTTAVSLGLAAQQRHRRRSVGGDSIDEGDDRDSGEYGPQVLLGESGGFGADRRSRASGVLPIAALNATLQRLSLADQLRIPQHLADTLMWHGDDDEKKKGKKGKNKAGPSADSNAAKERDDVERATVVGAAAANASARAAPSNRPQPLRRGQLASLSSVGIVSSGEYDGDDDSDAILRSRRSSQEDEEGDASTLPSTTAADMPSPPPHSDDHQYRDSARYRHSYPPPWDGSALVVEGRFASHPQWDPHQQQQHHMNDAHSSNDAVAAIIQSISDELYHVDQVVSTRSDDDNDDNDFFPDGSHAMNHLMREGDSSSGLVESMIVPPSDTMRAVVVSNSTSTATRTTATASPSSSSPYRYLSKSDTNRAVVASGATSGTTTTTTAQGTLSSSSASGLAIRPSDTMQAVVNGRPVSASERSAAATGDGLFPPNLMLSMTVPSPGARSTPSARNNRNRNHQVQPPPSSSPDKKLVVSPGRIPAYPIDLSEAPSPPHAASEGDGRIDVPFSVPEDRIRALYEETDVPGAAAASGARPASTWERHRRGRSASPSARRPSGYRDVIERARVAIAASVSSTSSLRGDVIGASGSRWVQPQSHQEHEAPALQGMRHMYGGGFSSSSRPPHPPPPPAASGSSRASSSSAEPDSDAAVVTMVLPAHGREPPLALSASAAEAPTPRTKPSASSSTRRDDAGALSKPASAKLQDSRFFPPPSPSSRDEDDYDTWLESALATQTFDDDNGSGNRKSPANDVDDDPRKRSLLMDDDDDSEPLRDWLDSVLP